ncbi:hypothetical protein JFL43_09830 [Viridibacillus sp. YIM B01967]|uniref:Uncharacterized protein n=1 Tax=Viridibacillus soli TaxID=2798301 RepID=A0ABS1H771_9BACL|nr:hypothetical protein [Viridibacillus soli]MBK3495149.1 hypothetical protein [Viridibacillus soli]
MALLSIYVFILNLLFYVLSTFVNVDLVPGKVWLGVLIICPIIGVILALVYSKGKLKVIGLSGNLLIFFIAILFPYIVTTFIWNRP